ncbi:MAG: DUF6371 domain-containing protein, partial [Ginsengibacter sp.]
MDILYKCPGCQKETLRRFVYKDTGLQVDNEVGSCKIKKCGYYYSADNYFKENMLSPTPFGAKIKTSFVPESYFIKSLGHYEENNFIIYLTRHFGKESVELVIKKYSIGTSKRWEGSTVFWQIDREAKKRTGRIIKFNSENGLTVINLLPQVTRVHERLKLQRFNPVQCLFGEHLLIKDSKKPLVITQNESTAVIASILYPEYNWLATNG